MTKKDKNSADGKTSEKAHFDDSGGKIRDEELGAQEKVLAEVAAEEGNESPLREGSEKEKSSRGSRDDIRPVKM